MKIQTNHKPKIRWALYRNGRYFAAGVYGVDLYHSRADAELMAGDGHVVVKMRSRLDHNGSVVWEAQNDVMTRPCDLPGDECNESEPSRNWA